MDSHSGGLISCENTFRVKGGTICNYLRNTDINQNCTSLRSSLRFLGRISVESMSVGRRKKEEQQYFWKGPQKYDSRGLGISLSDGQCLFSFLEALSLTLNVPYWHTWKNWKTPMENLLMGDLYLEDKLMQKTQCRCKNLIIWNWINLLLGNWMSKVLE